MLYIILLLILAVLLFGASAVIGVLGIVLGFIVAAIALIWASIAFDAPPIAVFLFGVGGLAGMVAIGLLIAKMIEPWEVARMQRKTSERTAKRTGLPGGITPAEREAIRAAAKNSR